MQEINSQAPEHTYIYQAYTIAHTIKRRQPLFFLTAIDVNGRDTLGRQAASGLDALNGRSSIVSACRHQPLARLFYVRGETFETDADGKEK